MLIWWSRRRGLTRTADEPYLSFRTSWFRHDCMWRCFISRQRWTSRAHSVHSKGRDPPFWWAKLPESGLEQSMNNAGGRRVSPIIEGEIHSEQDVGPTSFRSSNNRAVRKSSALWYRTTGLPRIMDHHLYAIFATVPVWTVSSNSRIMWYDNVKVTLMELENSDQSNGYFKHIFLEKVEIYTTPGGHCRKQLNLPFTVIMLNDSADHSLAYSS